ncbi:MAG: peptidase [Gemmatimonadetes bacterium]|nr:peptidase [Gemmatimonadota bacterium]
MTRSVNRPLAALGALMLLPALGVAQMSQPAPLPLKYTGKPTTPAISAADAMTRLYIFADDSMMGRATGTIYQVKGTDYIAAEAKRMGLVPAGENGGWFQNIGMFDRKISPLSKVTAGGHDFMAGTDLLFRDDGPMQRTYAGAQAVFGGVFTPDGSQLIAPADVAGKVVVITVPNGWQANRGGLIQRYFTAAAIVIASYDAMPADVRTQLSEPTSYQKGGDDGPALPAFFYASKTAAQAIMGASLDGMARGTAGTTLGGSFSYDETQSLGRNVVAMIPGSDPKLKNEYVAFGAHNDHIGFTNQPVDHDSLRAYNTVVRPGGAEDPDRKATDAEWIRIHAMIDSLRKIHPPRLDSINNGADDDGSGTVGLLEIAENFAAAKVKPKRSLLFVWHAGEELGMLGSGWYTDHPTVPRDSIVAQLNIDMIGRGSPDDLKGGKPGYLQLIGSKRLSTELGTIVEQVGSSAVPAFSFDYQYDTNGNPNQYYCRSDHYEYARYGIPITFVSTGGHRDYHQVTDEPQYIDYAQLARTAQLVHDVGLRVANLDHRVVVDHPKPDPKAPCRQ